MAAESRRKTPDSTWTFQWRRGTVGDICRISSSGGSDDVYKEEAHLEDLGNEKTQVESAQKELTRGVGVATQDFM